MKQTLLILWLLMASSVGAYADDLFQTLIVKLKNGTETAFFLKDQPKVEFVGKELKVTSTSGETAFAISDVLRFTYQKMDLNGINEKVTEPTGVAFENDVLVVSQLKANATVSVYAIDGKLIRQLKAVRAGTYRLNLSELPTGLYLVRADNTTYKITKP